MRTRRSALIGIAASLLALGTGATTASAAHPTADGVSAILLDPPVGCSVQDAWATLNANWSQYGSIPVSITTGGHLCQGTFTLADLEAYGADTVILDSTAYDWTLTSDEIQALQTYLNEGHTLLGQATVFQWDNRHSNHGLAPLFGLADQSSWFKIGLGERPLHYKLREHDPDAAVLLRNVANPYVSGPFGESQQPADRTWAAEDLDGARYIAKSHNRSDAITVYDAPAYTAIYISSSASSYDQSTPDDLQFLYNAIVYPSEG